jgi:DNA end-binding protein Ku
VLTAASTRGAINRCVSDLQPRTYLERSHSAARRIRIMGTAVWKGLVRFGLISIPVKLYRAAKAEKISFRQLHKASGARVRHKLCTEVEHDVPMPAADIPAEVDISASKLKPNSHGPTLSLPAPAEPVPPALSRQDVTKGYEYGKDHYLVLSRGELAPLIPSTACEISIGEFVQPAEIDLTYFDSTFYVVPNRAGEPAYAVLFQALARTGCAGLAQITMHSRESVVILRACGCRIIAQTLFYDAEIRREREYRANIAAVGAKELDLAVRLIEHLTVPFEPMKYFDRYRDGLQGLVRTRIAGQNPIAACDCEAAGATALVEALERSLQPTARKSSATESRSMNTRRRTGKRQGTLGC